MSWPCLFGHSRDWHRGPTDADGKTEKLCDRCLRPVGVLLSGTVTETRLPQVVAGQPTGKAQRVVRTNVTEFARRDSQH